MNRMLHTSLLLLIAAGAVLPLSTNAYVLRRDISSANTATKLKSTTTDQGELQGHSAWASKQKLPHSDIYVSRLGLGTMTFGEQVCANDGIYLLDKATKEHGINLVDCSELNPAPFAESLYGASDKIVGKWLSEQTSKFREDLVISAKISGYSNCINLPRGGKPVRTTREQVFDAVNKQLERLQTSYLDILQFQMPDRYTVWDGALFYDHSKERKDAASVVEILEIVGELQKAGKVRHFALSNESPYGVGCFATAAQALNLPRPISVQIPFNLLERSYVEDLREACAKVNSDVAFIAYSPLAGGALTGKYADLKRASTNYRLRKFVGFMTKYISKGSASATKEYVQMALKMEIPPTVFALAWVCSQPQVASTLLGVTTLKQLEENVKALNIVPLSEEVMEDIDRVYKKYGETAKGVIEIVDPDVKYVDPLTMPWGAKEQDIDPELDEMLDDIKV